MKTTLIVSLIALSACTAAPVEVEPICTRDLAEADFLPGTMSGSGMDAQGALMPPPAGTQYVISSTYLRLPPGEKTAKRFRELMGPILASLSTQDGLMAVQFGSSEECTVARTLTVWRDEPAMYKFVASPAHAEAMGNIEEVSRGGSLVTHWKGTEADATWAAARKNLLAEDGTQY
jgi:heme-degrading monooxygenase HmoA